MVQTRFPPEPNGYLHLGHLKALVKSMDYAKEQEGQCYLRFDDTNPETEDWKYVNQALADLEWLGFKFDQTRFTSDYFPKLYQIALKLIDNDLAYIDSSTSQEITEQRIKGDPSPDRNRDSTESRQLFEQMIKGEREDVLLRLRGDPEHSNNLLRDPVIYRVKKMAHYRTGDKWSAYPAYDFAHCLSDAIEGTTHSFCTLEFKDRRPLYYYIIETVQKIAPEYLSSYPEVWEFNRLNLEGVEVSKRKLRQQVEKGDDSGFSLVSLRKRGFPPQSLIYFVREYVDYSSRDNSGKLPFHQFKWAIREWLYKNTLRRFGVLDALKTTITNFGEFEVQAWRPDDADPNSERGRWIPISEEIYLDGSDFEEVPPPKYKRLTPTKSVRLKYLNPGIVKYSSFDSGERNLFIELTDEKKPKGGTIQWISSKDAKNLAVWYPNLNEWREMIVENNLQIDQVYQFERMGYFYYHPDDYLVEIISLKD